eukprot:1138547-Pelagomonas_calceolata.AAC.8
MAEVHEQEGQDASTSAGCHNSLAEQANDPGEINNRAVFEQVVGLLPCSQHLQKPGSPQWHKSLDPQIKATDS